VLADQTYAHLLHDLADNNFTRLPPELREDILVYYTDPDAPNATKRKAKDWRRVQIELLQLKTTAVIAQADREITPPGSKSSQP
jgi:hypothetical protein